ncbi:MarR family winged helix-turn-helix transcriptional regulator [Thermoanaerobacterium sp. RBIITD]|uniref:MarR family winged helix-turn-helix transcriptional regulator n=1 Tax=Thermoanaerobacterium sp. RBIITD TaxID=1550240 RepID=UPI000BB6A3B9|nr:MarR family winged helix-turn-helix transcriptional regulator [Thermoanaerobacterium sp. RBIITD]
MKKDINKICELLLNVICEFYENDSKARTFGTDTELYHSEIHMLQCIQDNPGLHISAIARKLGITRGAASQTVKRLERKQMIVKEMNQTRGSKVVMHLTPKGETACFNHKCAHEKYNTIISQILTGSDEEQLKFLTDFLLQFEKTLKEK